VEFQLFGVYRMQRLIVAAQHLVSPCGHGSTDIVITSPPTRDLKCCDQCVCWSVCPLAEHENHAAEPHRGTTMPVYTGLLVHTFLPFVISFFFKVYNISVRAHIFRGEFPYLMEPVPYTFVS